MFHSYSIIFYENGVLTFVFNCVRPVLINLQLDKGLYELVTRQKIKNKNIYCDIAWSLEFCMSHMLLVIRVLVQIRIALLFSFPFLFKDSVEIDMLHGFWYYYCCSYIICSSLKLVKSMDAGCMMCHTMNVQNAWYTTIVHKLAKFFCVKYKYNLCCNWILSLKNF